MVVHIFYFELNDVSQEDMLKFTPLTPVNVTLFENRVLADVIRFR